MDRLGQFATVGLGKDKLSDFVRDGGGAGSKLVQGLLTDVIKAADLVMKTATASEKDPFVQVKRETKGIAIDKGANINRPDFYCVHSNTLLPCLLVGDQCQLLPMVQAGYQSAGPS